MNDLPPAAAAAHAVDGGHEAAVPLPGNREQRPVKLEPEHLGLIRRKAAKLARLAGFNVSDHDDLAQELTLRVLQRMPAFDPEVAHFTGYLGMVLDQATANVLRDRGAAKRDYRRHSSLNRPIGRVDGNAELGDQLSSMQHSLRTGFASRDPCEQADLRNDLQELLATLSADERRLARALMTFNLTHAAQKTGISRTTATKWLMGIRKRCRSSPLQEYLEKRRSISDGAG